MQIGQVEHQPLLGTGRPGCWVNGEDMDAFNNLENATHVDALRELSRLVSCYYGGLINTFV